MAEENTATSSHLDSYMHVYDNGTTARLYVTPWDRNTVADGYWQTVNTIQPLINRDIYLADAIDKIATKHTVYTTGWGIDIDPNADGTYTISVNVDDLRNIPTYEFNNKYFTTTLVDTNVYNIDLNIDNKTIITADHDGIYCNIEYMMSSTSAMSSYSSVSANTTTSFSYDYSVNDNPIVVTYAVMPAPNPNIPNSNSATIYFVG